MNRTVMAAVGGAAGTLALAGVFAGGYAIAGGHIVTRTRVVTHAVPAPTVTRTRVVYRTKPAKQPHNASASQSSTGAAVAFSCKVLQVGVGQEEFHLSTTSGATYSGTVHVSFYDYSGSGDVFSPTTVQGATPATKWYPVPAGDIGASAEPAGCVASVG